MKFHRHPLARGASVAALVLLAAQAGAIVPRSISEDDFAQFSKGELESASLSSDGFLSAAYARHEVGNSGAAIVWDALREPSGGVLCATGHHGQLVRIGDDGTTHSLGKTGDAELTALVRLPSGLTLAAGAPSGRIYGLATDDTLTTMATLANVSFVWRMVADGKGDVWAATGPDGRLFRLHPDGARLDVTEVAHLKSSNLLDLWIDAKGVMGKPGWVYVAGQDPGWVYRVSPSGGDLTVVYNAAAEEVRALAPYGDGLALALNTQRAPTPQALSLTLRMAGGDVSGERSSASSAASGGSSDASLARAFAASRQGQYGQPRSEVVVLGRDGFTQDLWTAQERPISSLAAGPEGSLLAAAGNDGRVFEITDETRFATVADVRDEYVVRLVPDSTGYLLASARNGVVYQMDNARASKAVFLSGALDATVPVAWGHFYALGDFADARVRVAFRTGNDGDVDSRFWSAWSDDETARPDEAIAIPSAPARYLQYRLTISGGGSAAEAPHVDSTEAFFLEPNAAPRISAIRISPAAPAARSGQARAGSASGSAGAPPSPLGQPGAAAAAQIEDNNRDPRSNAMQVKVTWQASDPNDDTLTYKLYFRGEKEKAWKLIQDDLTATQMAIDVGGVADGRYRFKVVASDEPGNAPGKALEAEKVSDAITIDNTPPEISRLTAAVDGRRATIRATVSDTLSILSSADLDIDNGDSLPLVPTDGLMDQTSETFETRSEPLDPGEHVATLVATDRQGNSSVKKIVFTVDE